MRHLILFSILSVLSILPGAAAMAQDWALGGYDPVGYKQAGRAVPGRSDIATMWKGQLWHFSSEENRARFESNPRSFAPGFDGMCPVALSEGRREPGDPRYFALVGGDLYLLRSDVAERRLMQNPREILAAANQVWATLK